MQNPSSLFLQSGWVKRLDFVVMGKGRTKAYNTVTDSGEFLDVQAVVTFHQIKDAPSTETHGQGLCLRVSNGSNHDTNSNQ